MTCPHKKLCWFWDTCRSTRYCDGPLILRDWNGTKIKEVSRVIVDLKGVK